MTAQERIGSMLEMLNGLRGTYALTQWEEQFVGSCWAHSHSATQTSGLSEKQVATLEQIYRVHFPS